jgi:hypothetical protein
MSVNTYGRWPWVAAAAVLPTWALVATKRRELLEDGRWVAGLALPILLSHQSEEWVAPGSFLPFCNEQVLGSDRPDWPLTRRDAFHINVSVGWTSAIAGLLLWRRTPAPASAVLWLEVGNVVLHTGLALRKHRYNPGLVTAALLMGPHAFAAARWTRRSGRLSRSTGVAAATVGLSVTGLPVLMKLRMRSAANSAEQAPSTRGTEATA